MTTNFNFTRFTNLLKLDIAEKLEKLPFWFVGYLCRFPHPYAGMVVESFRIQLSSVLQQYAGSRFSGNQFFFIFYASRIMICMNSKEKRISYLLLPATMFEKFLSRFVIVTVFFLIQVFACPAGTGIVTLSVAAALPASCRVQSIDAGRNGRDDVSHGTRSC